jgi:hypothetical protein
MDYKEYRRYGATISCPQILLRGQTFSLRLAKRDRARYPQVVEEKSFIVRKENRKCGYTLGFGCFAHFWRCFASLFIHKSTAAHAKRQLASGPLKLNDHLLWIHAGYSHALAHGPSDAAFMNTARRLCRKGLSAATTM